MFCVYMTDQPPSYDVVAQSVNNYNTFLDSCRQLKRSKRDVERQMLKNKNNQRDVFMKLRTAREKAMAQNRKVMDLEAVKAQLEEDYRKLEGELRTAEEIG
jgi:hypothetical protein